MATETALRPGEIKDILLREIEAADLNDLKVEEVGTVLEVKDGIARIYGLSKAMAGEMLSVTSSETGNEITALELANALRRFIVPSLAAGKDCVHELPERRGPLGRTFVLVFLARSGTIVLGATAMEVECVDRWEAKRRLKALQRIMQ